MSPNHLSPAMHRAIVLERQHFYLLQDETLANDPVRLQCEQLIQKVGGQLTVNETAQINYLQLRSEARHLRQQGLTATDIYCEFQARQNRFHRAANQNPEIDCEQMQDFMLMVGLDFELYDEEGELWCAPENPEPAEVINFPLPSNEPSPAAPAQSIDSRIGVVLLDGSV